MLLEFLAGTEPVSSRLQLSPPVGHCERPEDLPAECPLFHQGFLRSRWLLALPPSWLGALYTFCVYGQIHSWAFLLQLSANESGLHLFSFVWNGLGLVCQFPLGVAVWIPPHALYRFVHL